MKKRLLLISVAFCALVGWALVSSRPTGELKVDFLNVGQGDSILIRTPGGHQILVDGGPDATAARDLGRLMPFYDRRLDLVVATHPQADHYGGLTPVLRRYRADHLLWNGQTAVGAEWSGFVRTARQTPKTVSDHRISYDFGDGARLELLYPRRGFKAGELADPNEGAIVLRLEYGKNSVLLTSDTGETVERMMLGERRMEPVTVLKVPHHGSRTGMLPAWLSEIQPHFAVIEVGAKNLYGHPTQDALNKLAAAKAETYRTDKDGTVELTSKAGATFTVKTHALRD